MGTWGTAVFSDDLAADIREEWRGHIADGLSPQDATDRVLVSFSEPFADSDDASVLWIALAVAQWKTGRLLPDVRDRAVATIDSGEDLARWDTAALRSARQRALVKARAMLLSQQPDAKRIRRPWVSSTPFEVGDVLQVDLSSGHTTLVVVVGHYSGSSGGRGPIVESLNWVAPQGTPSPTDLAGLERVGPLAPERPTGWNKLRWRRRYVLIAQRNRRDDFDPERVRLVGVIGQVRVHDTFSLVWWGELDAFLITRLGLGSNDADPVGRSE